MANLGNAKTVTLQDVYKVAEGTIEYRPNRNSEAKREITISKSKPQKVPVMKMAQFGYSLYRVFLGALVRFYDEENLPSLRGVTSLVDFFKLANKINEEVEAMAARDSDGFDQPRNMLLGYLMRLEAGITTSFSKPESKRRVELVARSVIAETLKIATCTECSRVTLMTAIEMGWPGKAHVICFKSNQGSIHYINIFKTHTESRVLDLWSQKHYPIINIPGKLEVEKINENTADMNPGEWYPAESGEVHYDYMLPLSATELQEFQQILLLMQEVILKSQEYFRDFILGRAKELKFVYLDEDFLELKENLLRVIDGKLNRLQAQLDKAALVTTPVQQNAGNNSSGADVKTENARTEFFIKKPPVEVLNNITAARKNTLGDGGWNYDPVKKVACLVVAAKNKDELREVRDHFRTYSEAGNIKEAKMMADKTKPHLLELHLELKEPFSMEKIPQLREKTIANTVVANSSTPVATAKA